MSLILIVSTMIQLIALGWSINLWRRIRDWRIGLMTVMFGLMALQQILALLLAKESWAISITGGITELPWLVVSILAFLVVLFLGRLIYQQVEAREKLRQSEASLAEAQRIAHVGNWDWDILNNTLRWSDEIYRIFGLKPQEFGATYEAFLNSVHPDDREFVQKSVDEALCSNKAYGIEHRIVLPDGSMRTVHEQGEVTFDENGKPVRMVGTVHDITERKQAEEEVRHLNDILQLLRNINQLIIQVDDEPELLQRACDQFIGGRSYKMAWIGFIQEGTFDVLPVAQAGFEESYLSSVKITWDDSEHGQGPTGTAIKTGQPSIMQDILNDPRRPWREQALKRDYRSSIVLPLMVANKVIGALNVYSECPDAFGHTELGLLVELAGDLSLGIEKIRQREERQRAEERIRQLQEYLQLQVERMPVGLIVWDTEFRVQSWNPAAEKIFGFTAEDTLGKHPYDLVIPKEAQPHVDNIWHRLLEGDMTAHSINENLTKDGCTIICEWLNTPLKKADSTVVGVLSMVQDITEQKRMEEDLKQSEKKYSTLVERGNDGIIIIQDSRIKLANRKMLETTGFALEEAIDKLFVDFVAPEYRELVLDRYKRRMVGEDVVDRYEVEFLAKDGRQVPVEINASMIEYEGRPADMAIIRDITERKRAEETLRESQQRYQSIVETASDAIVICDNRGNITSWNNSAERMFGYSVDEVIGRPVTIVWPKELRKGFQTAMKQMTSTAKTEAIQRVFETVGIRKDGSKFPAELSLASWRARKGLTFLTGITRDITKRIEAEEEARELKILRQVDSLRSRLLSNVSHELRTPLASIKGFTSTLLRKDTKWSEEEQRDFLETIDQESDRLTRLISDLLDMSRLEAGALKLDKDTYHISEILESVDSRLATLTSRHRLQKIIPSELPPVFADEMRIGQVLTNLVENSTKYSQEDSEITIEAKFAKDEIVISVIDRGEGIPTELLDKIFDRFYQTEGIVTGRKSGTGLGLSICQGIIKAHGGRIWVESEPGKGSKFSFSLPVTKGEPKRA